MKEYKVKRFKTKTELLLALDTLPCAPIDVYGWVGGKRHDASARLGFAEDYGFICKMEVNEASPAAVCRDADGPVCNDSCLEFFVSFDGESYLNLEANCLGVKCMGFGPGRHDRLRVKERVPGGFRAAPMIEADRWSVVYYLPFAELSLFYPGISAADFPAGREFTANFYKTGSAEVTGVEHYGMWSECLTENPDFHRPEYFGKCVME